MKTYNTVAAVFLALLVGGGLVPSLVINMNTRYQGKSTPLPAEWFSDSDDSDYSKVSTPDSDYSFCRNYSESEEEGWSTETNNEYSCCSDCAWKTYDTTSEGESESSEELESSESESSEELKSSESDSSEEDSD